MKIAQVSPLMESVPPKLYGGTERVVSFLTDELVRQGYDVTLFASGDSRTLASLVPCGERALRLDPDVREPVAHHVVMLDRLRRHARDFDIIHCHVDLLPALLADCGTPLLFTLHGRQDLPDLQPFYRHFADLPLVSISDQQREPLPPRQWAGTVYHGLPPDLLRPVARPTGDYLAFLGRMCAEKRPDRAVEIARRTGLPLRLAAKIDRCDLDYFNHTVKPLLDPPAIEHVGEITDAAKPEFLGNARALLFPIDWPEPFGLALIEAMACGTPVVAWNCGSVPEVVDEGVTGFIVDSIEAAAQAVEACSKLDRARVRARFKERFGVERMAREYLAIYRSLVEPRRAAATAARPARAHLALARTQPGAPS